ncbi:hypothetical protein ABIE69_000145 [Rhodobacteraceae bacterium MBR-64]|jgi:hypothetical protein
MIGSKRLHMPRDGRPECLAIDRAVLCAGQVPLKDIADDPRGFRRVVPRQTRSMSA